MLIIGDWGTGMNDAITMLQTAIKLHKPTAIIHLGDIYYSGTYTECKTYFVQALEGIFNKSNIERIPVFSIPGNHEYYSGGWGFYTNIRPLNIGVAAAPNSQQEASYFCLRTKDGTWQFLGMDTGINDHNATMDALGTFAMSPFATGPGLMPTEVTWHIDKLTNFSGNTILMSHHPVFSANYAINGWATPYPPYINSSLFETFLPYFGKISAWFWGHEHNFVYFQDGLFGINKARLLGNSAYEEQLSSNPYTINYPSVAYAPNMKQVGLTPYSTGLGTYYNHSYAVVQLARAETTDPITISYYQYASWGTSTPPTNPPPAAPQLLYSEQVGAPNFTSTPVWSGNTAIKTTSNDSPKSNAGPSLAIFDDRLYMAYKGQSSDDLYLAWYDGAAWSGNTRISDMAGKISPKSNYSPALATYNGLLYMIYKGSHSNDLYVAQFDGTTWSGNVTISGQSGKISPQSSHGPAAMAFNGQLMIVYTGETLGSIYSAAFDGTNWTGNTTISTPNGTPAAKLGPSLALYQPPGGVPLLYMGYIGQNSTSIYMSWFDGSTWSGNSPVTLSSGDPQSTQTPWMAQLGDDLVMLSIGKASSKVYCSTMSGTTWSGNQPLKDISPIAPETDSSGAMMPYGVGIVTTYIGEHSAIIYQAKLQIFGQPVTG